MEGEIKASMARFWTQASSFDSSVNKLDVVEHRVHPEVSKALVWIENNYTRQEALQEFYSGLTMSSNHFRKLFQQYAGHSFTFHLRKLRMREAMNLLKDTSHSIKEIAAAVGFNDALYFSRRFHQYWDIAPSDIRK